MGYGMGYCSGNSTQLVCLGGTSAGLELAALMLCELCECCS